MTRKEAREEAFILIFEKQFNDESLEDIFECAEEIREIKPDEYMKNVVFGVFEHLEEIDDFISKNSKAWSINRISKTALAVLRLALYEIKYIEDIPVSVSINEAVELCKKYSTKEESSFVNGLLANVSKE